MVAPQPENEDVEPKDEFESIEELLKDDVRVRHHGWEAAAHDVDDPVEDHEDEDDAEDDEEEDEDEDDE